MTRRLFRAATTAIAMLACAALPAVARADVKIHVNLNMQVTSRSTHLDRISPAPPTKAWVYGVVEVQATETCHLITLIAPGAIVDGGPISTSTSVNEWDFNVHLPRPSTSDRATVYTFQAECQYLIFANEFSETVEIPIRRWDIPDPGPLPDQGPQDTPTSGSKDDAAQGPNAGGSTDGGSPRLGPGAVPASLPAPVATLLGDFAAREIEASGPMLALANLPDPTGPVTAAPTVAPPPPMPAVPPGLPPGAVADVSAAFANEGDRIAIGNAAVESLARLHAAEVSGDAASVAVQLAAADGLVSRWADAIGAAAGLRGAAQAALVGAGLGPISLSADQVAALRAAAYAGTLPAGMAAQLAADRATPDVIDAATGVVMSLPDAGYNGTPTIADADVAQSETAAASELRKWAAVLRAPAGTPPGTPTTGNRVGGGTGEIKPVACVAATATPGCSVGIGLSGTAFFAISPDARNVYIANRTGSVGISSFVRDPINGRLTQLKGKAGCLVDTATPGCTTGAGMAGASDAVVSPDGRNVYVAAENNNAIVILSRNRTTGALRELGCITSPGENSAGGCAVVAGFLGDPKVIALSPDGRFLYVPSEGYGAVTWLARNPTTGILAAAGCIARNRPPCTLSPHLSGPAGVAVTPDGQTVVIADRDSSTVIAFDRDATTGALVESGCVAGNGSSSVPAGCQGGVGIGSPEFVAASARQDEIVVGSSGLSSVVLLQRNRAAGALSVEPADTPCVTDAEAKSTNLCLAEPGLGNTYGVVVSPDGRYVYAGAYEPGSVSAYERDPITGNLVGLGPCWSVSAASCRRDAGLKRAGFAALSPDGRHLYVAAPDSNEVTAFARRLPVAKVKLLDPKLRVSHHKAIVRVRCPATAQSWCVGTLRLRLAASGHGSINVKPSTFSVVTGGTGKVAVPLGSAASKLHGKVTARITATALSPFGAHAATHRTVHGRL